MKVCFLIASLTCVFFGCGKKLATEIPTFSTTDFETRDGSLDSRRFHFRIFVPKDRAANEKLPVMLYLHGSDDRGDDNERQLSGLAHLITANPATFRFLIVFPQCKADRSWDKEMIEEAMSALDQTVKESNGDETRLYLAGFSLGGYGTWSTAAMYSGKFAAIIPMSGRVLPRASEMRSAFPEIVRLANTADPYSAFADRIGKTPVWVFHGANDNIVPIEGSRKMVQALKNEGDPDVRYSELEGVGHYSLDSAFADPELFNWLSKQKLNN